jgi:hypothetical protein
MLSCFAGCFGETADNLGNRLLNHCGEVTPRLLLYNLLDLLPFLTLSNQNSSKFVSEATCLRKEMFLTTPSAGDEKPAPVLLRRSARRGGL